MKTCSIKPTNFWSSRYVIEHEGEEVGRLNYNNWSGNSEIISGDQVVNVMSEKWYTTSVKIIIDGEESGRATYKTFSFRPSMDIEYKSQTFRMKAKNSWMREYEITFGESEKVIGTINKKSYFSYSYESHLPDSVDVWFHGILVVLLKQMEAMQTVVAG